MDLSDGGSGSGGVIGIDGEVPCWQTNKLCSGTCTPQDQVATGCATASCEPCIVPNADAKCDESGACVIGSCHAGFANCDTGDFNEQATGCEINILSDITNCGACGNDCSQNGPNWQCIQGVCCESQCAPGTLNCTACGQDTTCETQVGVDNCGSCGNICSFPHADPQCNPNAGVPGGYECGFFCQAPYADCDTLAVTGCETNLGDNVNACGNCKTVCNSTNGTPTCTGGNCGIQCVVVGGVLYGNCDSNLGNGCETPLNTIQNCGTCGNACNPANANGPICTVAGCSYTSCQAGFKDCDGNKVNGCETALNTATDCGDCGVPCNNPGNGTASCATQSCVQSCNSGYQNCDGNWGNGCESLSSLQNCAGCGTACNPQHVNGANCNSQTCGYASCSGPWGDCDGTLSNGCEQSLHTIPYCGSCSTPCAPQNANGPTCSTGACDYASCKGGFDDCDSTKANGCETTLGTNQHCSSCAACTGGKVCNGGSCQCPPAKPNDCGGSCAANCCTSADCTPQCCVNDMCIDAVGDAGTCP